jgi:hypothetical protein
VITDDPGWKSLYNQHPDSVNLTSACISSDEAKKLLAAGAVFEAVVLLNDAGEELLAQLSPEQLEHPDLKTRVERIKVGESNLESVSMIHDYLKDKPQSGFFQTAGG